MRRILVIKPNTSESAGARLQSRLGGKTGVEVHTVTARFGAGAELSALGAAA